MGEFTGMEWKRMELNGIERNRMEWIEEDARGTDRKD